MHEFAVIGDLAQDVDYLFSIPESVSQPLAGKSGAHKGSLVLSKDWHSQFQEGFPRQAQRRTGAPARTGYRLKMDKPLFYGGYFHPVIQRPIIGTQAVG